MPERSPDVMRLARAEAVARGQELVGTEHLLVALAGIPDRPASRALAARGVYPGTLRAQVHRLTGPGSGAAPEGHLPCTPWAKRAVERAVEEARALGHRAVEDSHLMLALLDGGSTVATEALRNLGVAPEALRADVLREARWDTPPTDH